MSPEKNEFGTTVIQHLVDGNTGILFSCNVFAGKAGFDYRSNTSMFLKQDSLRSRGAHPWEGKTQHLWGGGGVKQATSTCYDHKERRGENEEG